MSAAFHCSVGVRFVLLIASSRVAVDQPRLPRRNALPAILQDVQARHGVRKGHRLHVDVAAEDQNLFLLRNERRVVRQHRLDVLVVAPVGSH